MVDYGGLLIGTNVASHSVGELRVRVGVARDDWKSTLCLVFVAVLLDVWLWEKVGFNQSHEGWEYEEDVG